ncbi:hypothetical protein Q0Z83_063160 [Actinoplanes sichuanensis]|uniref:WXG100 family type VII secretion target n=1 Tax=Actinoplanes sichuanensis TaxID=512349 RepID=A0ABW4A037_9ACTN|nr:hypothetical protein [Actinoplanes sichuanensis]BEL08125.1 hypothetical protein Q0Z83_063160 [Actinoplanes sichuanensis]
MTAPVDSLAPPVADPPVPDLVNNILGMKQYISMSYWAGELMDLIWGFNPWDWVAEQFAGDWEAVAKAGDALSNLAEFNESFAQIVGDGTAALIPADWDGNAAVRAERYFTEVAHALTTQIDSIQGAAGQFRTLAAGMEELAQAVQSLCQDIADALIILGVTAAATMGTSWTGVGAVVGGSATASQIANIVRLWYLVLDAHDAAWAAVQAFTGISAGYLGALQGMELQPLPGRSYDHPGV